MTQEEADKIARVVATAAQGSEGIVENLCELLSEAKLGFVFQMTGGEMKVQPDWSHDPQDAESFPEVIATIVE